MIGYLLIAGIGYGVAFWISSRGVAYWRSVVGFLLALVVGWLGGGLIVAGGFSLIYPEAATDVTLTLLGRGFWWAAVGAGFGVYRGRSKFKLERQDAGFASPISVRLETMSQPVPLTRSPTSSPILKARDVEIRSTDKTNQHQAQIQTSPSEYVDMDDDAIYATVAEELESGKTDKGLWTRLFAECGGDEKQVKVLYIKRRAEKLIVAESTRREQVAIQQAELRRVEAIAEEKAEQLRRRNAGLAEPELVAAVWDGNWATASRLLSEGISPLGLDANGASLLDLATRRGDSQMVDLLKSYGAGIAAS